MKLSKLSKKETNFSISEESEFTFEVLEMTEQELEERRRMEENERDNEKMKVMNAYLRRVLLQFFLQGESTRDSLVPLILGIVGCTDSQIAAAQRQWEKSNQLIQKTTSFFSFK